MRTLKSRLEREYGEMLSLYSSFLLLPLEDHEGFFLQEEKEVVSTACEKRQADFLTGRYCARKSMEAIGLTAAFVPVSSSRAPLWPSSVVGSITHTEGYCAALVGLSERFLSIGIDGQRITCGRISDGMKKLILRDDEDWQNDLELNLVFSAKESLFKCLNPLVEKFFGFHCASVTSIDSEQKTFSIELKERAIKDLLSGKLKKAYTETGSLLSEESLFKGIYEVCDNLVVTAIILKQGL
jgi:4'-phosphopantetheinyl transferase EntD